MDGKTLLEAMNKTSSLMQNDQIKYDSIVMSKDNLKRLSDHCLRSAGFAIKTDEEIKQSANLFSGIPIVTNDFMPNNYAVLALGINVVGVIKFGVKDDSKTLQN